MTNLIKDGNGNLSHTKIWSNVGYLTLFAAFIYHTITNAPIDLNLWTIFSATFIVNRSINKHIEVKNNG